MLHKVVYILVFTFFLFPFDRGYAQSKLKQIDKLTNDSAAIHQYEEYLKYNKLTVNEKLNVILRISTRCCVSRDFEKGVKIGNQGIVLAQQNGLDSMEAVQTKMLGITYYFMEQRKKAINYFEKAITLSHKCGDWFTEATCYNNIGAALIELKEFDNAENHLMTSITIMKQHDEEDHTATGLTYRLLASLYNTTKKPEKAEPIYLNLIEKSRQKKDTNLLCSNLLYYADLLAERGDLDKAVAMSGEALMYIRHQHNASDLLAGLRYHAKHLALTGKYKESLELQNEAYVIVKKSFTDDLEKKVSEVEVKYKTEQIQKEKEVAEENIKKQKWIYLLSFLGLIIISGFVVYIFNQRKNNQQKITNQKQRLESIIEGEEKERSRIAKDLHDGIVQNLTAIKLKVQASDQPTDFLKSISSDIDEASKEIRNIAYQMMPIALREYGLIKSLEDLLQKTLSQKNILFEIEPVNITERLPEKIEICLYRITQELLNNVIKHSHASFVSLVITKHQNFISLIFEDNGQGFNQDEVKKGIGMNSLSSRLEIVNGELKFESSLASGTMAIIKIPFKD